MEVLALTIHADTQWSSQPINFSASYLVFSNGVTEAWPIMFFGGSVCLTSFTAARLPMTYAWPRTLMRLSIPWGVMTPRNHFIWKKSTYTKWLKHVAKQMHLIARGFWGNWIIINMGRQIVALIQVKYSIKCINITVKCWELNRY